MEYCWPSQLECNGQFPLDTSPLRYVSAMSEEEIGFTLVYVLIPTRSTALHICLRPSSGTPEPSGTDTQDFYFCRMPEHDATIQLNLARSRQEVKCQNNKQCPVTFQNTTSTQISKKRHTQALLLILRSGTLCVVVLITQTYNCGHEWLCDYHGNSSALRHQLSTVLCCGGLTPQPVGIAGRRSKTGSEPQSSGPTSSGNWG